MGKTPDREKIIQAAKEFDDAIAAVDKENTLKCFAEECEIELLGMKLQKKCAAMRWFHWMYLHLGEMKSETVLLMVDGNSYFREFIVHGKLKRNGGKVTSKQSEVIVFDGDYKIKSLRVYFDRFDFAESVAKNSIEKYILEMIKKETMRGLM